MIATARCELFHPPLQGEGRSSERSEDERGGVAEVPTPHPGSLRSPTLPLQGRVGGAPCLYARKCFDRLRLCAW